MATGKEDDATAALAAEANLKDAIDQAMKGTANTARRNQVAGLSGEFGSFTRIFAEILKVKRDSALAKGMWVWNTAIAFSTSRWIGAWMQ